MFYVEVFFVIEMIIKWCLFCFVVLVISVWCSVVFVCCVSFGLGCCKLLIFGVWGVEEVIGWL